MSDAQVATPRCVALVGPYLSGKTTLLESLLAASGAIHRKGAVSDGSTVGDHAPEARDRKMSVELTLAHANYLGDEWRFIDCPGSVELLQDGLHALAVADLAVVVVEPEPEKAPLIAPIMKLLEDQGIPHVMFVNKMDNTANRARDVLAALQQESNLPLVLRQVPIREGDGVSGYVDLISERAYHYNPDRASDLVPLPDEMGGRAEEARTELLESLADFNDTLLEQLLEDSIPEKSEVYAEAGRDLRRNLIVPVILGAGLHDHGVRRLLKLLRHEAPDVVTTAARKGLETEGETVAQVFKTCHVPHAGKMSFARIWRGSVKDGDTLSGSRVSGLLRVQGAETQKMPVAAAGEVVAFGRMDAVKTGDVLTPSGTAPTLSGWPEVLSPVYAVVIGTENRQDEVKLSGALARLTDEDPSLSVVHDPDTHEMLLRGQGEVHMQIACDRLRGKYNLAVTRAVPRVPYRETIRKSAAAHGRFKRQTGGHGQFGDVKIEIRPQGRGEGFAFEDRIFGGHIPRQYIPAVEEGVKDYLQRGPLGFPVVDVAVALCDGAYHNVDSSEQAFKQAARLAMTDGMARCESVLLEPILEVRISIPGAFTNKVHGLISGRRGQILGFDAKDGWKGWDEVLAHMPQSETADLIIELRSLTMGVGFYRASFDHLAELTGRDADRIVNAAGGTAAAAAQ